MPDSTFDTLIDSSYVLMDVVRTLEWDLQDADLKHPSISKNAMSELRWLHREANQLKRDIANFCSKHPTHSSTMLLDILSQQLTSEVQNLRQQLRHTSIMNSTRYDQARFQKSTLLMNTVCTLRLLIEQLYHFLRELRQSNPDLFVST